MYFGLGFIVLLIFFVATWQIHNKLSQETSKRVNVMVRNVSDAHISNIKSIINAYAKQLENIENTINYTQDSTIIDKAINQIIQSDSSIKSIELKHHKIDTKYGYILNVPTNNDSSQYFCLSFPLKNILNDYKSIQMTVNLRNIHQKIIKSKDKAYAYVTIIFKGKYLYHPDEKMIGKSADKQDVIYETTASHDSIKIEEQIYSDYLKLDVYRYYTFVPTGDKFLLYTANSPNLGFVEYMQDMGRYILLISVLAVLAFITIFILGALRWRSEFVKRQLTEQQNLSLQLKNEQQKQSAISSQLELLKSGLNPHFLFNSLTSLGALVSKDVSTAKEFAVTLSKLYRYLLKQENKNTVKLKDELEFTLLYINLQKIRFANKIIVKVDLHDEIMYNLLPPVSLQLLVENCIKHTTISAQKPLNIHIYQQNQYIVTENNYNPRIAEDEHSGKGISNLRRRYSFLTPKECYFNINDGKYIAKIPILF